MNALPTNIDVVDTKIAATSSFDYGTVDASVVDDLRGRATKIRGLIAKSMDSIISTGRELIIAKAQIAHGDFEAWVESEARISVRAAQQYMSVARFADQEDKSATLALFPAATAYRLVSKSMPPNVRDEVLGRAEAGEVLTDGVVADLVQREQEQRKEARAPLLKEKQKAESKKRREQRLGAQQEHEARQRREKEDAEKAAVDILDLLGADKARALRDLLGRDWRAYRVLDELWKLLSEPLGDVWKAEQSPSAQPGIDAPPTAPEIKPGETPDLPAFLDRRLDAEKSGGAAPNTTIDLRELRAEAAKLGYRIQKDARDDGYKVIDQDGASCFGADLETVAQYIRGEPIPVCTPCGQPLFTINGGRTLVWAHDDPPPTTVNGVDHYHHEHTAIAGDGACYSIRTSSPDPDTGEIYGHTLTLSTDDGQEEQLGKRLGLNEAKSLAQRDYERRTAPVREGAAA